MTSYAFTPWPLPSVAIDGSANRFPLHRIYCVGRNYTEHAREMGGDPQRDRPFFFMKPADAVVESGTSVPFPLRTDSFHHEVELVVALAGGGVNIPADHALEHVFGYAVGIDFTRRDLQLAARKNGGPWDAGKGFDRSAAISAIRPAYRGHIQSGRIWLTVNDELRQQADVAQMVWPVPQIIAELSTLFELKAGDLIFTGTPAGVGPLSKGDRIAAGIDEVGTLTAHIQ